MRNQVKKLLIVCMLILCAGLMWAGGDQEVAGTEGAVEFSLFIRAVPDFVPEDNPWVDQINRDTDSKVNWIVAPPANAWEKRNVLLASGDYPEVVMMQGPADALYGEMLEAGKVLAVDEYLENAPHLQQFTHQVSWQTVREDDGRIYMVPRCTIIREDFTLNRKDWRESLGLETPQTPQDWVEYATAVATQDPDGNGENDTYGFTDVNTLMTGSSAGNIVSFAKSWHAGRRWYDDGSGNVFMGMLHRDGRFKQVLEFYKALYQSGGLEPDIISNKGIAKHDKWKQGVVATNVTFVGAADSDLEQLRKIHLDANVEFLPFPEVDLTPEVRREKPILTQTGIYNGWSITDKGQGKEAHIIGVFDYLLSDAGWSLMQHGVEDVHYRMEDGQRTSLEPAAGEFHKWRAWAMMFRRPLDKGFWLKKRIPEIYPLQEEWFETSVNFIKTEYIQSGLAGFISPKEREFMKSDVWTTRINQVSMQIVVGALPLSAWDDLLDEAYAAGWQDVVDEYQAHYDTNK